MLDRHCLHPGELLVEVEQVPGSSQLYPTFPWSGAHEQLPLLVGLDLHGDVSLLLLGEQRWT